MFCERLRPLVKKHNYEDQVEKHKAHIELLSQLLEKVKSWAQL